mmetsp:Transcript_38693/g.48888  ORF Transcript_38693/g.48888 Transcript_38693/m.48888 type:complete len:583 (+) Transcript_38693:62-1810(+)
MSFLIIKNVPILFCFLILNCTCIATSELSFEIQNKYSKVYGKPGQHLEWLEDQEIAEPFVESILCVTSPKEDVKYRWWVADSEGTILSEDEGTEVSFMFSRVGKFVVSLYEISDSGETYTAREVSVKYVRREIRKLFPDDRDDLLDAMKIMWSVSDEEGKALYGERYMSVRSLLVYHQTLAGDRTCDHMHDGYAFVSAHSALSFLFEQSLQAIDPKVSLPYWDYIYDIEEWNRVEVQKRWDFTQSELFSADFFGITDEETHYIADGRWANLVVPLVSDLDEEERNEVPHNAYGQIRAPWANNADPHLIRGQNVCGSLTTKNVDKAGRCASLESLWGYNTFENFMYYISYMPHGRIHLLTGGAFFCDEAYEKLYDLPIKPSDIDAIRSLSFAMQKDLYRWGKLECDEKRECYCPDLDLILKDEELINEVLNDALFSLHLTSYSRSVKEKLVETICNSKLVPGDQLQSSSSYMPEFWPIHPNVERMYQVKKLGTRVPKFSDETWPQKGTWLIYPNTCGGHGADDKLLGGKTTIYFNDEQRSFTNSEFLELLDPTRDTGIPFIYDDLSWDYCNYEFGQNIYGEYV